MRWVSTSRIGDELAVDLQRRHHVGEDAHLVGLVRRERLAQHAGGHGALGAHDTGRKSVAPPIGAEPCLGPA
jgi:hypothetical protein